MMRTIAKTPINDPADTTFKSISSETLVGPKKSESAMRRYFYDSLAADLSLYVRPEDEIVEIDARSAGLSERFANYKAVSSAAELKTLGGRPADYKIGRASCRERVSSVV